MPAAAKAARRVGRPLHLPPFFAFAQLYLRSVWRNRLLPVLLVVAVAASAGFPAWLPHDGTPEGRLRLSLVYGLGLARVAAMLVALLLGCAALPQEREGDRLPLAAVKPVRAWQVWLGLWLGVALTALAVLAAGQCGALAGAAWVTRGADGPAARAVGLASVRRIEPRLALPEDDLRAAMQKAQAEAGGLLPPTTARRIARQALIQRELTTPAGEERVFHFAMAPSPTPRAAMLHYRLATALPGDVPQPGVWRLETGDEAGPPLVALISAYDAARIALILPANTDAVRIRFHAAAEGSSVLFAAPDGLQLHLPIGRWPGNWTRGFLTEAAALAALAALGLTCGAAFTAPVAAFAAAGLALAFLLARFLTYALGAGELPMLFDDHHGHSHGAAPLQAVTMALTRLVAWLCAPWGEGASLARVAEATRIEWRELGAAWLRLALPYTLALALLGTALLRRRELGAEGES